MYQSPWSTYMIWHTMQHEYFYHIFENKNILFLVEICFTCLCKFYLNDFCIDFFLQMIGWLVKLKCEYFPVVIQTIEHHHQHQSLQFKFDHFLFCLQIFFNGISRFIMYSSSCSEFHNVSGWWVKCHINVVILCVLKLLNWDRLCCHLWQF